MAQLGRRMLYGVLAIVGITAMSAGFGSVGWTVSGLFAAVIAGIGAGAWAAGQTGSTLCGIAGLLLFPCWGVVDLVLLDVPVLGGRPGPISVDDAPNHRFAAAFHFTDARVATEFTKVVDIRSRGGTALLGVWRAAPIVAPGWTRDRPVAAWAVAEASVYSPPSVSSSRYWAQPYRGGARHVQSSWISGAHEAVDGAVQRYGLSSVAGAPLIYWTADPEALIAGDRAFLVWMAVGGSAAWALILLGDLLLGTRRDRRAAAGG